MNQDDKLIFEAYRTNLLNEAPPPLEMGGEYQPTEYAHTKVTTKYKFTDENIDDSLKYVAGLFPGETEDGKRVLRLEDELGKLTFSNVKKWIHTKLHDWILSVKKDIHDQREVLVKRYMEEGQDEMQAKKSAVAQVRDPWPNATNVNWSVRVVVNDMLGKHNTEEGQPPFIDIVDGGASLKVDIAQADDVKDDIRRDIDKGEMPEDPAQAEDVPSIKSHEIVPHKEYNLNPDKVGGDRIDALDDNVKKAIGEIRAKLSLRFTGQELIVVLRTAASGIFGRLLGGGTEKARELGSHMLEIEVIEAVEDEADNDAMVDVGDEEYGDSPYDAQDYASSHFGDLGGGSMDEH